MKALSRRRTRPLAILAFLSLFVALALGGAQSWNILEHLDQARKAARVEAQVRARLSGDFVSNIINGADQTLSALMLGQDKGARPLPMMIERGVLFSSSLAGIALFDQEGNYVAGFSREGDQFQNCGGCRFFRAHKTEENDIFIGSLLGDAEAYSAPQPIFGVSRRILGSDGKLTGVIAAIIDTSLIEANFAATSDQNVKRLALSDLTGTLLASWSDTFEPKTRLLVQQPHFSPVRLDKIEGNSATIMTDRRIIALHRPGAYPIWIALSFDPAQQMAAWHKESRYEIGLLAAILSILGILAFFLARQMLDRYRAEEVLEKAQEDLERRVEARTLQLRREIQERRRAEESLQASDERFQRFMDNIPAAAFIKDENGRYVYVNRQFYEIYGLQGREIIGRKLFDLFPPEILPRILADDLIAWRDEKSVSGETEMPIDGQIRTYFFNKFPLKLNQGQKLLAGVVLDVTEQRATFKALAQAQKMQALGHLTGGIAHDFNNLLTIILGNLEMAQEFGSEGMDTTVMIGEAKMAAKRGAALTEKLLAMFRRRPRPGRASCEVNGLLLSVSGILRRTLGDAVSIEIHPDSAELYIPVDAGLLESAILNLALNARDAMLNGGTLEISVRRRDGHAVLTVTDNGTGMTQDVLERAFEPFFTTKETGKGSGLGLSMVYSLANQAGGSVNIDSALGKGTKVTLLLPLIDPPADRGEGNDGTPLPKGHERLLVVEDEEALRRLASSMLESLGYEVETAANGPEALQKIEAMEMPPHLIFSDMVMPGGMDGFDLAAEIRKRCPETAILLASGHFDSNKGRGETGEWTVLQKPYDKATLARHIRAQLDAAYPSSGEKT